jgi:ribonuclease Z
MNMSTRELIALGTSSQVPTRERSHNAYFLRWDAEGFLFDPGEGAQRQMMLAGVAVCSIHHICITHFHGDHCLGLAGIAQRLSLDHCDHPVHIYYPESGSSHVEHLLSAAIYHPQIELFKHPVGNFPGLIDLYGTEGYALKAHHLEHSVPTIGFRLEEAVRLKFLSEKLDEAGVHGPMVGELRRKGEIILGDRKVRLESVTTPRAGNIFAFIMDTRACAGAVALAKDADLFVMEATYTSGQQELASYYMHSTAADAARTAVAANARLLAMAHFSQRYPDSLQHVADAREFFQNVVALNDLDRLTIPRRN